MLPELLYIAAIVGGSLSGSMWLPVALSLLILGMGVAVFEGLRGL